MEDAAIDALSFVSMGIIVNPQHMKPVKKRDLTKITADVSALPTERDRQVRFFRLLGVERCILKLPNYDGSDYTTTQLELLRSSHSNEVIGTLDDYLWMRAVSIIVPRSNDVFELPEFDSGLLGGIIFKASSSNEYVRHNVLPLVSTFSCDGNEHIPRKVAFNWFQAQYRAIPDMKVWSLLLHHFEEATTCPGLGDAFFRQQAESFASGNRNYLVNDWSGILAFMPGIIWRAVKADSGCTTCLVAAPSSRVAQLVELIKGLIDHLGVTGVSVGSVNHGETQELLRIAVGMPALLAPANNVKQLVLVETDALLSWGFKKQVEELLSIPGVQVGLHACERSLEVEDMVSRFFPDHQFDPKAGLSLENVDFYRSVRNKMAVVCRLWNKLEDVMDEMQLAVYCNSPESVKQLGRELEENGVPVCLRYSSMPAAVLKKLEESYNKKRSQLLVTDIYNPWSPMDVVLYDMPETSAEFVERVQRDRNMGRAKIVYTIVNGEEDKEIVKGVSKGYNVKFNALPADVMQTFLHSKRTCL